MPKALRRAVWSRAQAHCEYCLLPAELASFPFAIDHIQARQHGGQTVFGNLALVCQHCNLHKGPNIAGIDTVTGRMTRLFHPRRDAWPTHFRWVGVTIEGITEIGRATVAVLAMNDDLSIRLRANLADVSDYPPVASRR